MPESLAVLLQCGPITDFSLMIGLNMIANGGHQIHTSHCGGFLRNWIFLLPDSAVAQWKNAGLAIVGAWVRIPLWYHFEDWAFSFTPLTPLLTQLYK